jgi:hypothetical protein
MRPVIARSACDEATQSHKRDTQAMKRRPTFAPQTGSMASNRTSAIADIITGPREPAGMLL